MDFVRVARSDEVIEGRGTIVKLAGTRVALFRVGGSLYAIRNQCPHMGGDLGEGLVEGDVVRCPWHGWRFSVRTGRHPETEVVSVRTYEVREEEGEIYVRDPDPPGRATVPGR